ncbi:RrF2 family transcriptional regulator [Fimbriimonas ginsengisoli]|uniref:Transcriptional regulator, BadM/Rrf2 family n=1 Tax=Fimbriimonas ginsengisoli Gsoil 348 TaxID=661478 RepID=A0A068NKF1_FIMGI|nr:Rrf2 family transcriptional regulator [Fimbriimonas ginsengisoli]AIE83922.1 transcriptional regulator, BadM/Rrf2 family [Fimbriimonas ginsengisoli Gsoil 348]
MKFSAQEEYGLRCLLQIARLMPGDSMTIPQISEVEALSQTHVAKLLMILRKEGFVRATRGQLGGYTLARAPEEIPVGAVLAALGGKLYDDDFCNRHAGQNALCTHAIDCSVRSLWQVIQGAVDQVVDRITLADLLASETPKPVSNVTLFAVPQRATR